MQQTPESHFKDCVLVKRQAELSSEHGEFLRRTGCNCVAIHERIMQRRAVQSYLRTHPDEATEL